MSIPRLRDGLLLLWMALPLAVQSAAPNEAAERERIARQRSQVERESQAAQAQCATQFVITACVERVRAERRERMQVLDRQRAILDDEWRKRRAAERVEQIRQRQASAAEARPEVTVRTRTPAASAPVANAHGSARSPEAVLAERQAAASQAAALAGQRASAAKRRADETEAHRLAVEKRNQARANSHAPSKPLPSPPAASKTVP